MNLNEWIKSERELAGYTQEKLAEYLNFSQQQLQQYEKGTRRPSFETLQILASFFNASLTLTATGWEIQSSRPELGVNTVESLGVLKDLTKRKEAIRQFFEQSLFSVLWNEEFLSLSELKILGRDQQWLTKMAQVLVRMTDEEVQYHRQTQLEEMFCPFEFGSFEGFSVTLMHQAEQIPATVNLSLFRDEYQASQSREPIWEWYVYTELDGRIEHIVKAIPVETSTVTHAIRTFLQVILSFVKEEELEALVA